MHNLFLSLKQISQFVAISSAETSQPLLVRYLFGIISMIKEIMSRCHFRVSHQSGLVQKKTRHTAVFSVASMAINRIN